MSKSKTKKSKKPKREKIFTGCIKMPLNTNQTEEEMLAKSTWFGDWATKSKLILSKKRIYFINVYMTLQDGREGLFTYKTKLITSEEMKPVLELIIKNLEIPDDIDWDKSYLTISC